MSAPLRQLVEAGAGCGKTYGLVSRYICGMGYDPESGKDLGARSAHFLPREILALTFTEEAAEQMLERVLERLDRIGLSHLKASVLEESQISTFHSLCFKLLKPVLAHRGYPRGTQTNLVPTPFAKLMRSRAVLNGLAQLDPKESQTLLRHLRMGQLANLGSDLWFADLRPSSKLPSKTECAESLRQMRKCCEQFQKAALTLCEEALRGLSLEARTATPPPFIVPFIELLRDPSDRKAQNRLKFVGKESRQLKALRPDLAELAELYRDFLKADVYESLSDASIEEEVNAQIRLLDFFANVRNFGGKHLDFSALEAELAGYLRENGNAFLKEQGFSSPKLLLVDEFQDTNRAQYAILQALSSETSEWYFVGDPKQSIYAFRGADVSLFLELKKQLSLVSLTDNWRSTANLLEILNGLQQKLFSIDRDDALDPPPQVLIPKRVGDQLQTPFRIFELTDESEIFKETLTAIESRKQELKTGSSIAVLFKSWNKLHEFSAFLDARKIEHQISGKESLLDHPLTQIFCEYLIWAHDPEQKAAHQSLMRWKSPSLWKAHPLEASDIRKLEDELNLPNPSSSWSDLFSRFSSWIDPTRWKKGDLWAAALERQIRALQDSGVDQEISRIDLALMLLKEAPSLEISLPHLKIGTEAEHRIGLHLLTIHGSKGLEFDAIILPQLYTKALRNTAGVVASEDPDSDELALDLKFVDSKRGTQRSSLYFKYKQRQSARIVESEQRRLLYVAFTRAKQSLDVIFVKPTDGSSKSKTQAMEILGWPDIKRLYWNVFFSNLKNDVAFSARSSIQWIESPIRHESTQLQGDPTTAVRWNWPRDPKVPEPQTEFYREGVSRYLERIHPKNPYELQKIFSFVEAPLKQTQLESIVRGEELHELLELWNGDPGSLKNLVSSSSDSSGSNFHGLDSPIAKAATELRQLPALKTYWSKLRNSPHEVQREFGMLIHSSKYRLTGFADALYFEDPKKVTIIDWKTGSSLARLERADRTRRITSQLKLYAEPFQKLGWQARGLAIGIEFGQVPLCRVLIDTSL